MKSSRDNNSSRNLQSFQEKQSMMNLKTNNIVYQKMGIKTFNDYEINSLSYKEALFYDKRTYFEYYLSLLRRKQLIIFCFYTYNDYNSKSIKICVFFFTFSLNYTVNTLFFTDETLHQVYEDNGEFNFMYQLPQMLYSMVISSLINIIIKSFSMSEQNILSLKKSNNFNI